MWKLCHYFPFSSSSSSPFSSHFDLVYLRSNRIRPGIRWCPLAVFIHFNLESVIRSMRSSILFASIAIEIYVFVCALHTRLLCICGDKIRLTFDTEPKHIYYVKHSQGFQCDVKSGINAHVVCYYCFCFCFHIKTCMNTKKARESRHSIKNQLVIVYRMSAAQP